MSFRNAFGIYHVIEQLLKQSPEPLTCVDLFDDPEIKKYAADTNRVSDYLGHMYRRGLLKRSPAPRSENSAARFAYSWKGEGAAATIPAQRTAQPRLRIEAASNGTIVPRGTPIFQRPHLQISEDGGNIFIDLPQLSITIKAK